MVKEILALFIEIEIIDILLFTAILLQQVDILSIKISVQVLVTMF
jgi:hypothetical protein